MNVWGKRAARDTRTQLGILLVDAVYASACMAMLLRHGSGGLTRVETKNLWVQEATKSQHFEVLKMNAADSYASLRPAHCRIT